MTVRFHHHTQANGLTIIAETNPAAHTSAAGFFVNAGTRDEPPQLMGVSHFLEHMLFKGTATRTGEEINRRFDDLGANYNAFTTQEMTAYWAQVLPDLLPEAIDLLADILRPALHDEDFEMERKVILEEIGMYEDRPFWRVYDHAFETYFGDHPLSMRVLGTTDSIGKLSAAAMRDYYRHWYGPDNIVFAAAGAFEFPDLVAMVEQATGAWAPTGAKRVSASPDPVCTQLALCDPKLSRQYVARMAPAPAMCSAERVAADVLENIVGDTEGSHLYWALVDPGIADEADLAYYPMDGCGVWYLATTCTPRRLGKVRRILEKTLSALPGSITAEQLQRAKHKLATATTLGSESPRGRMSDMAEHWLYTGEHQPLDIEIDRLMAVTLDDLHSLLHRWPLTMLTEVTLGPR